MIPSINNTIGFRALKIAQDDETRAALNKCFPNANVKNCKTKDPLRELKILLMLLDLFSPGKEVLLKGKFKDEWITILEIFNATPNTFKTLAEHEIAFAALIKESNADKQKELVTKLLWDFLMVKNYNKADKTQAKPMAEDVETVDGLIKYYA